MKLEYSQQIFEKYLNIKFHENPSSGIPFVPCGRTGERTDRDMAKLIAAFRNFANAPKNVSDLQDILTGYINFVLSFS